MVACGNSSKSRCMIRATPKHQLSPATREASDLRCGVCGSNFVMAGAKHYACASRTNGGTHACTNNLRVARSVAESKLLARIKAELGSPEYLDEFKRAVRQALTDARDACAAHRQARAKRLAELSGEIEHMVAAVAAGLLSPALTTRLEAAESERVRLSHALVAPHSSTVVDLCRAWRTSTTRWSTTWSTCRSGTWIAPGRPSKA